MRGAASDGWKAGGAEMCGMDGTAVLRGATGIGVLRGTITVSVRFGPAEMGSAVERGAAIAPERGGTYPEATRKPSPSGPDILGLTVDSMGCRVFPSNLTGTGVATGLLPLRRGVTTGPVPVVRLTAINACCGGIWIGPRTGAMGLGLAGGV